MSTIVVGVDGSDHSKQALRWAVEEAALRRSDLTVVYAYEHKVPIHAYASMDGMSVEQMQRQQEALQQEAAEARERAQGFVEGLVREVDHAGVRVQALSFQDRHPADVLVEQSEGADMLVVGSRGLGGFKGLVLGSVSQQCLHHATCPVLVIRSTD